MYEGQAVSFFDAAGNRHSATITKVSGTGKSSFKILDLTYRAEGEPVTVEKALHENDAAGGAFWLEKGKHRKSPVEAPESGKKPKK